MSVREKENLLSSFFICGLMVLLLPMNCLSVSDHFVGLALERVNLFTFQFHKLIRVFRGGKSVILFLQ